ncbi:MAG TPA: ABC transporter permease [Candidatus Hydrogenedentes bacterium]|nr:ABC transporter permease [Candidatus Hydrogenedentota bacterium]
MTFFSLILRGLAHHRRMHASVAAGTLIACAALSGALLVGDSVDGTLRGIAVARLGRVTYAIDWGHRFFSQDLPEAIHREEGRIHAAAVLALRGIAAIPAGSNVPPNQINQANMIGVGSEFWRFAEETPAFGALGPQEAAMNEAAARLLGVAVGDDIALRIPKPGLMPRDAPLAGNERDASIALLVTLKAVLTDRQLGRFSLAINQATPCNVFLDRTWLQDQMDLAGRANLLLADDGADAGAIDAALERAWTLEHIGLAFRRHPSGLVQLESSRIFIEDEIVRAALDVPGARPSLTYLANSISKDGRTTPYSFVAAGGVPPDLPGDAAIINSWLAETIGAAAGDRIEVAYMQLQPDNAFVEKRRSFHVSKVASMDDFAIERELAPRFPGLSDVENCRDWDIGMPLDAERLDDAANEAYWNTYGQTPKLLIPFDTGKELWGTRFGSVMAVRFPAAAGDEKELERTLCARIDAKKLGLAFAAVRQRALDGVNQAMDFGGLMTAMSAFLIGSALILLGLLYSFGLQQRAGEMGTLMAVGYSARRIRALFMAEAFPSALFGAVLGAVLGALYGMGLLVLLVRLWPDSMAETSIRFHARTGTLVESALVVLGSTLIILWFGVNRAAKRPARELLSRDYTAIPPAASRKQRHGQPFFIVLCLAGAAALGAAALSGAIKDLPVAFLGSGFLLLMAGLGGHAWFLGYLGHRNTFRNPTLWKLALANLARRRSRSLGVAAAIACGCFLVLSVSAMRENLALHAERRDSGTGGFPIYAETSMPVMDGGRAFLKGYIGQVIPLRVREGDDAGCLNLNRAQSPRLFGVNAEVLGALDAFADKKTWKALLYPLQDGQIPVIVGDTNTALWGLNKKTGLEDGENLTITDESGQEVTLKLVESLPMRLSVFQGALILSESDFTRLFPSESGHRAFLIETPPEKVRETVLRLNREYSRIGMQATRTLDRLEMFYGVETAYLTLFLVLGGLGLMLGGAGAGIVALRNLHERQSEIALLHALGYDSPVIFHVLLVEHAALCGTGILMGACASAAAIIPMILATHTQISLYAQTAVFGGIAAVHAAAIFAALHGVLRKIRKPDSRPEVVKSLESS